MINSEIYALLKGDGVTDDALTIQALLDKGGHVYLPPPKAFYLIGQTLRIGSNTSLKLDRFTVIKLKAGSDCLMITNVRESENISITGGIWDFNNKNQAPNPVFGIDTNNFTPYEEYSYFAERYLGVAMRFFKIKHFFMTSLTIKDPVTFGFQMAAAEQFTVEDITFDYNDGNPVPANMDGIHLDGDCRFGVVRNLKGACYDDLLALNADDFHLGPISNIEIDGIFAEKCHSAVRMLSARSPISHIHISNIYGTYFQYTVGLSKFYHFDGCRGFFDDIVLTNIFASKAPRDIPHFKDFPDVYPIVWVQSGLNVHNLHIQNLHRRESKIAVEAIGIEPDVNVKTLSLRDVSQVNALDTKIPLLLNNGKIDKLFLSNVQADDDTVVHNNGEIRKIFSDENE